MPTCVLTGNRQVNVSEEKANKILRWKDDPNIERDKFVDLGLKNFVSLNQIKQVLFNEKDVEQIRFDEKHAKFSEMIKDWNDYVARCVKEDAEAKAKKMTRSGCYLLWKARMNKDGLAKELYEKIMFKLIPYFESNKNQWWAGREEYQELIPVSAPPLESRTDGWKTLGELMFKK